MVQYGEETPEGKDTVQKCEWPSLPFTLPSPYQSHPTPHHPAFQASDAIGSALEGLGLAWDDGLGDADGSITPYSRGKRLDGQQPHDFVVKGVKFRPRGEGAASSSSGGLLDADVEGAAVLQSLM